MQRFAVLDGLRGIAALAVVVFHVTGMFGLPRPPSANLAVDFFFCLSGFVVAHAYDGKNLTPVAFGLRRFKRLYPLILLGVLLGGAVALAIGSNHLGLAVLLGALLIPTLGPLAYPLNAPMWSLVSELIANALYGLERGRLGVKGLALCLIPFAAVLVTAATLAGDLDFGVGGKGFWFGLARAMYPFALGVVIRRGRFWEKASPVSPLLLAILLAGYLLAPVSGLAYGLVGALLFMPLIVLFGAASVSHRAIWSLLGELSYPVYIVHAPVLLAVHALMGSTLLGAAVAGAASLAVAALALELYDKPVRRLLNSRRLTPRAA